MTFYIKSIQFAYFSKTYKIHKIEYDEYYAKFLQLKILVFFDHPVEPWRL